MPRSSKRSLTHVDARGHVHMVDVGDKAVTRRAAVAVAEIIMGAGARRALRSGGAKKGDVAAAARIAGIQAAKRTSELIPLCHPVGLTHVRVEVASTARGARVTARAETTAQTGVEMEALVAASVAALTLYDMLKAVDRGMVIERVALLEKSGGRSGTWRRKGSEAPQRRVRYRGRA